LPGRQLFAVAISFALVTATVDASTTVPAGLVGDAFDRRGQLRYREFHDFDEAGGSARQVTIYRDPSGREIGRMEADYARDRFAPDYRMVDHRHDTEETVRREGDRVVVEHRAGAKRRAKTLRADSSRPLIVGPGFNEFIGRNWDALLAGRTLVCDFVIPSRLQVVSFRIRHTPEKSSGAGHWFTVSADNALLRLLAPELRVEYDRSTRALLSYVGPSNVTDDRNDPQDVVIRLKPSDAAAAAQVASGR
jgi:hypothetical protein